MKLVNYYRGAYTKFDCVIHGTIYMTNSEWSDCITTIMDNRKKLDPYGGNSRYEMFLQDTKRAIHGHKYDFYNIRVTATGILVDKAVKDGYHINFNRYKLGNYQIAVKRVEHA